jgi:hypothetical protein
MWTGVWLNLLLLLPYLTLPPSRLTNNSQHTDHHKHLSHATLSTKALVDCEVTGPIPVLDALIQVCRLRLAGLVVDELPIAPFHPLPDPRLSLRRITTGGVGGHCETVLAVFPFVALEADVFPDDGAAAHVGRIPEADFEVRGETELYDAEDLAGFAVERTLVVEFVFFSPPVSKFQGLLIIGNS